MSMKKVIVKFLVPAALVAFSSASVAESRADRERDVSVEHWEIIDKVETLKHLNHGKHGNVVAAHDSMQNKHTRTTPRAHLIKRDVFGR